MLVNCFNCVRLIVLKRDQVHVQLLRAFKRARLEARERSSQRTFGSPKGLMVAVY